MSVNPSREAEPGVAFLAALRDIPREVPRYFVASGIALSADAALYIAFIRVSDIHYLAAAPVAYAVGILIIYLLSTRWVFSNRRVTSGRSEFLIFTLVGIITLLVNQLVIYACVENLSTSYEVAKLVSAAIVFGINFGGRKLLLFTRF